MDGAESAAAQDVRSARALGGANFENAARHPQGRLVSQRLWVLCAPAKCLAKQGLREICHGWRAALNKHQDQAPLTSRSQAQAQNKKTYIPIPGGICPFIPRNIFFMPPLAIFFIILLI